MVDIRTGDRPSMRGKYLGEALVIIAREGRKQVSPGRIPEPCLTCAFRPETLPNQCVGTGLLALDCLVAPDERFACHHGMKDGEPQKICAGFVAAKMAPRHFTAETLGAMHEQLERLGNDDHIRDDFDKWYGTVDPKGTMDVYQLARLYAGREVP